MRAAGWGGGPPGSAPPRRSAAAAAPGAMRLHPSSCSGRLGPRLLMPLCMPRAGARRDVSLLLLQSHQLVWRVAAHRAVRRWGPRPLPCMLARHGLVSSCAGRAAATVCCAALPPPPRSPAVPQLPRLGGLWCCPAGEAAVALEQRSVAEAAQRVMRVLRGIFEPRGVEVPAPLQVRAGPAGSGWRSRGGMPAPLPPCPCGMGAWEWGVGPSGAGQRCTSAAVRLRRLLTPQGAPLPCAAGHDDAVGLGPVCLWLLLLYAGAWACCRRACWTCCQGSAAGLAAAGRGWLRMHAG